MKRQIMGAVVIAVVAALYASGSPDGLDKISEVLGFADKGVEGPALMRGYHMPFLGNGPLAVIAAALAGVALTAGLFYAVAFITRRRNGVPRA